MKINTKRLRKLFAGTFVLLAVVTMPGCSQVESIKMKETNNMPVIVIQEEMEKTPEIIEVPTIETPSKAIEVPTVEIPSQTIEVPDGIVSTTEIENTEETNESQKTDYSFLMADLDTSQINNPADYILDNLDRLYSLNEITIEQQTLALYAYKKLITGGISKDIFEIQLNNIMVEQLLPRCLDNETWEEYYGELTKTLDEQESLIDTYGTLAWLIHNESCDDEHSYEAGIIKCKTLDD